MKKPAAKATGRRLRVLVLFTGKLIKFFNPQNFFMPFFLSLKPQETNITLPKHEFIKMHDAEAAGDQLLRDCPGLHFVAVFFVDDNTPPRLITNLIQKGFKLYSWTQYKHFDRFNKIAAYFVLNGDHYIKLKPNK